MIEENLSPFVALSRGWEECHGLEVISFFIIEKNLCAEVCGSQRGVGSGGVWLGSDLDDVPQPHRTQTPV